MNARVRAAAAAVVLVLALAGCAQATSYPQQTAAGFQAQVLAVSEAAADSEFEVAATRLAELEASIADALARGGITRERFDSITAAIELVRADLTKQLDETEKPGKPDKPGKPKP